MIRLKGTVTVFLALILVAVMGVVGALLESARFNVAKEIVLDTAYLSIQNILAEYQRELWEDYHVFFVDAGNFKGDEGIEKLAGRYLQSMVSPKEKNFLNAEAEFNRVSFAEAMVEGNSKYFVRQAVEYMKNASPADVIKGAAEAVGGGEAIEKGQKTFKKMMKARLSVEKKLLKLEKKKERVREKYTEINKELKDLKEFVSDSENQAGELSERVEKFGTFYKNKKKEIEDLDKENFQDQREAEKEVETYKKELDQNKEDLIKEDYENLKKSTDAALSGSKETENRIEENEERIDKIITLSEDGAVKEEELREELKKIKVEEDEEKKEVAKRELQKYERKTESIMEEGGNSNLILNLLGGGGIKVSNKKIKKTTWKEYGDDGNADVSSWMDKSLFFLYMKKHFPYFLGEKKGGDKKKEALDYGLEYIVIGDSSDEGNLRGIAQRIFGIRTAVWFSYFLSRPDKVAEATEIAAATVGILGPAAVLAVKTAILLGWSADEARKDVKEILSGGKVPLHPSTVSIKVGYEKYLTIFLMGSMNHWGSRSVKLIEQNMRLRYHKDFQADNCFSGVVGEVKGKVPPQFFRLGFIRKMIEGELSLWEFDYQLSESLSR